MDYENEFRGTCNIIVRAKKVEVPKSPTKSQRITDFERQLKMVIDKLKITLSQEAEQYSDLAYKEGYKDISKLRTSFKNIIHTILREFKYEQEDNSGLY